jgi:hypothetical protein
MTEPNDDPIDWELTTWKGSRRRQHQEFHAIPFSRKLEIIEEMNGFALETLKARRSRGLPCIDPYTGKRVAGAATIREEPPPAPPANPENSGS